MTAPNNKTMLNYFTKLPSKAVVVEELNPRKSAPVFNRQHVEKFQNRLEQFDAELFNVNNNSTSNRTNNNANNHNHIHNHTNSAIDNGSNNGLANGDNECLTNNSTSTNNYIADIKSGRHIPFAVRAKLRGPLRARLFQYHEDIRPPYYGTWQRKSRKISGRRPFAQDDDIFDYEVDSEAEWDIGGPGESLKGDDSDDEEELDEYEIDMQTFVPHGYVSDDEMEVHSDQEEAPSANQSLEETCDVEDDSNISCKIICEKGVKIPQPIASAQTPHNPQRQTIQNPSPAQLVQPPPVKQAKLEIKPIILGIHYENEEPIALSESKLQFMKAFQGLSCN